MKTPPEAIKELLLEDYRYRADAMKNSEQSGETRLNIYIGVVTLFAAGIVTFLTSEAAPGGQAIYWIGLVAIVVLLVLGVVTLFRLLIRNENTDKCQRDLDHIRQMFKDNFDESGLLIDYYPVGRPRLKEKGRSEKKPAAEQNTSVDSERDQNQSKTSITDAAENKTIFGKQLTSDLTQLKKNTKRGFGGLAHMMAAINSMLFAGGVVLAILLIPERLVSGPTSAVISVGLIARLFVGSFFIQLLYAAHRELKWTAKIDETRPTHAGAVVYTCKTGTVQYLVITTEERDPSGREIWVLPKGKIENGEGHVEAALREVQEESRVVAKFICPLGYVEYTDKKKKPVRAKYYLMEFLFETPLVPKTRTTDWLAFEDAEQRLEHDEGKHLLNLAKSKLENGCAERGREKP